MTRGHRSDLPVLIEVARQPHVFRFVGVIGSRSKAAALRRELREAGIRDDAFDFECPIGLPIGGNHPGEIAVSIAARLLQRRDEKPCASRFQVLLVGRNSPQRLFQPARISDLI